MSTGEEGAGGTAPPLFVSGGAGRRTKNAAGGSGAGPRGGPASCAREGVLRLAVPCRPACGRLAWGAALGAARGGAGRELALVPAFSCAFKARSGEVLHKAPTSAPAALPDLPGRLGNGFWGHPVVWGWFLWVFPF